ncbi:MAG TPA: hypothetical protein VGM25_07060 [Caulobacteraceae bacterium]|jgi:hypothetical protein
MGSIRFAMAGAALLAGAVLALPVAAQTAPTAPPSPAAPAGDGSTGVSEVTITAIPYPKRMASKRPCYTGVPHGDDAHQGSADDACVQEVLDDLTALRRQPGYEAQFQKALAACLGWDQTFASSTMALHDFSGILGGFGTVEDNHPRTIQACGRARKADDGDKAEQKAAAQAPTFTLALKPDLPADPDLDRALNGVKDMTGLVTLSCEASGGAGDLRNCREAPGAPADPVLVKAAMKLAMTYVVKPAAGSVRPDPNQTYVVPVPIRFRPAQPAPPAPR